MDISASGGGCSIIPHFTAAGKYQSKLTRINMHRLWMHRAAISLPFVAHVAEQKDRVGIHFLTNEHQMPIWQNGRELRPGMIAVSPPDTEHYCRTSTGVCWGSMSLSLADLAAAGRALVECELTASAVTGLIQPPPHLMTRLLNLQEAAGRLAAAVPDILEHPEVCRAMEQTLIHVMVRCLEDLAIGPKSYSHQRGSVMRRFEQFLEEHPDSAVYLPEICAAIGVLGRTLRDQCGGHLGMSPQQYFWVWRCEPARGTVPFAGSPA